MAKSYSKKLKTKKSLTALLAAAAIACTGLAAACAPAEDKKPVTEKPEDTQLLKNGNFEFFDTPDEEAAEKGKAVYLIRNGNDWTRSGDTSGVTSGIIDTSEPGWKLWQDESYEGYDSFAAYLDYIKDLETTDDNYVNYNGLGKKDLPYKDTYAALLDADKVADSYIKNRTFADYFGITRDADGNGYHMGETVVYLSDSVEADDWENGEFFFDGEFTKPVRKQLIENPGTPHKYETDTDGSFYYTDGGEKVKVYKNDEGRYFLDEEYKLPTENILMVHNYSNDISTSSGTNNSTYNGISQYYGSSVITLEANTSAEISVWVKTSNLTFDKGYDQNEDQDRGAFIEVVQTVAGSTVDSVLIKAINTEKILGDSTITDVPESNGWIQYSIFVRASDFGDSTIKLNLGLGRTENTEKVSGYAFFDDVKVTKYIDLEGENGSASYKANASKLNENNSCNLADAQEDKQFIADKEIRGGKNNYRNARDFYYFIDLASASGENAYESVVFGTNTNAALTSQKQDNKTYALAEEISANVTSSGLTLTRDNGGNKYTLPKDFKTGIITEKDLLGTFTEESAISGKFASYEYSNLLTEQLTGAKGIKNLPNHKADGNMLVMFSAYGASYTSTVTDSAKFTVAGGSYKIVSYWVKTSDLNGSTAATVKVMHGDDVKATLSLDTTDKVTDIGDNKDIYNGWVECFFFIENDSEQAKEFTMQFCFGTTDVAAATLTSYSTGWAAFADLQVLDTDKEEIFNLASAGDYVQKFSFTEEDDTDSNKVFDEVNTTSDIESYVANPSNYNGVNGASSAVSDNAYKNYYDAQNSNYQLTDDGNRVGFAGLVNKEHYKEYKNDILTAFGYTGDAEATVAWESVFGDECYQPLIIINNIRKYVDRAEATKENYKNYWVEAEADYEGETFEANGRVYRQVGETEEFNEDTEYFSKSDIVEVANYGFIGSSKTISANSYETISVKVKVSGDAEAYIYLVDSKTRKVLKYTTPAYTFYYDDEGYVLDNEVDSDWDELEHRKHIVYTPRTDGLYDGEDGKIYANTYNLIKSYSSYKFEHNQYYTDKEHTNAISFDDLESGVTYYNEKGELAPHYLVNDDGTRVFEYYENAYYYLVKGERNVQVEAFDTKYARYAEAISSEYSVKVTNADTNDNWLLVNFVIHTGNKSVDYRLELWSGERDKTGVTDGNYKQGAIAFDYSAYSLSESNYAGTLSDYEKAIIERYEQIVGIENIDPEKENIAYFEQKLVADGVLTEAQVQEVRNEFGHEAKYFTYSLYDSTAYVPFNENTAEDGATGYTYKASDNSETLAYLKYVEKDVDGNTTLNVFADYSIVDKDVTLNNPSDDDTDDDDTTNDNTTDGNFWLYISSIILVAAILLVLVALLIRNFLKKRPHGSAPIRKNNDKQKQRYLRKLRITPETAAEAEENGKNEADEANEVEATDTEAIKESEAPAETAEETPAETETEEETPEATDGDENKE